MLIFLSCLLAVSKRSVNELISYTKPALAPLINQYGNSNNDDAKNNPSPRILIGGERKLTFTAHLNLHLSNIRIVYNK